jgi:acetyl esterase
MHSGVAARCRQLMGTIHGTEVVASTCPEISRTTARDLADFCIN